MRPEQSLEPMRSRVLAAKSGGCFDWTEPGGGVGAPVNHRGSLVRVAGNTEIEV
jgi:hypothetical protein